MQKIQDVPLLEVSNNSSNSRSHQKEQYQILNSVQSVDISYEYLFLKEKITPPKYSCDSLLDSSNKRQAYHLIQDEIWHFLIQEFKHPIKEFHTEEHRIIEVLSFVRYYIRHDNHEIHSKLRRFNGNHKDRFTIDSGSVAISPPLICNLNLIQGLIDLWTDEINAIDPILFESIKGNAYFPYRGLKPAAVNFKKQMCLSIIRAIHKSIYWKRFRYFVGNALAIDPELLNIVRRSRVVRHKNNISNLHLNRVLQNYDAYRQLNKEAPNLLWFLTFCLNEGHKIESTEPLSELKKIVLSEGCQPRGWRLLIKHQLRDFAAAVEFSGRSWKYLYEYIKLHQLLDRNKAIPKKLAHLFAEPSWELGNSDEIIYRNILMSPSTTNAFINALADSYHPREFMNKEALTVLNWLAETKFKPDSNQSKHGWNWLLCKATDWEREQSQRLQLSKIAWKCQIKTITLDGYIFVPLENGWEVRKEAINLRHCADNFIHRCKNGTYTIFSIKDKNGIHKATVGFTFIEHNWRLDQIKGFANRNVSHSLIKLAKSITTRLNLDLKVKSIENISKIN